MTTEIKLPDLENCPFCNCAMIMDIDVGDTEWDAGIFESWESATIWGNHDEECPFKQTAENGFTWDLARFTELQQVADIWNRRAHEKTAPPLPDAPAPELDAIIRALDGAEQDHEVIGNTVSLKDLLLPSEIKTIRTLLTAAIEKKGG